MERDPRSALFLQGIPASPGIAIGHVVLLEQGRLTFEKYHIDSEHIIEEQHRLRSAIAASVSELETLQNRFEKEHTEHVFILEAQILMIQDPLLVDGSMKRIAEERINAEWAVRKTSLHIKELFEKLEEEYFRERRTDVDSVCDRILTNLLGGNIDATSEGAAHGNDPIIVAHSISPSETVQWLGSGVLGLATDVGSQTAHTTIIARSLGIPAAVGLGQINEVVGNGDRIIVDGDTGTVIIHPSRAQCQAYAQRRDAARAFHSAILQNQREEAISEDGAHIDLSANVDVPNEVQSMVQHGGTGVGLVRTEFLFLKSTVIPSETEQLKHYEEIMTLAEGRQVTFRTFDIGGDKLTLSHGEEQYLKPSYGLRGIRYCLQHRALFKTQLRALLRASSEGEARLLLPFISNLDEVKEARFILSEAMDELRNEGIRFRENIPLGIMIEIPSAVLIARELAKQVDFFSVGTNDLIQYTLAIGRDADDTSHLYEPLHPAVINLLRVTTEAAKEAGIAIGICGEMAGVPLYTELLIGLGFRELSMSPRSIPLVKHIVRNTNTQQAEKLTKMLEGLRTAEDRRNALTEYMHARFPDLIQLG